MSHQTTPPLYPGKALVKVFFHNNPKTREELIQEAKQLFPELKNQAIHTKLSSQQTYSVLSLDLYVETEEQLKTLYLQLKKHPEVKMVL
jgi:putative lipoic acid-binding regulatory protein